MTKEELYTKIQDTKYELIGAMAALNCTLKVYISKFNTDKEYTKEAAKIHYQEMVIISRKYYKLISAYENLYGYSGFEDYYKELDNIEKEYFNII